jgi:hypothetical protein
MKTAYREFEQRVGALKAPRGTKTDLVIGAINRFAGRFTLSDLEQACTGVSRDMLRKVLKDLQGESKVKCLGRGPGAPWEKEGNTLKRG